MTIQLGIKIFYSLLKKKTVCGIKCLHSLEMAMKAGNNVIQQYQIGKGE